MVPGNENNNLNKNNIGSLEQKRLAKFWHYSSNKRSVGEGNSSNLTAESVLNI